MIKSLKDLEKIKDSHLKATSKQKKRIFVGLSSCGIAAGAKDVFASFEKIIADKNIKDVEIVRTGCVGYCYTEPTIEIKSGDQSLLLGPVSVEDVENVVDMHVSGDLTESKYVLNRNFTSCIE